MKKQEKLYISLCSLFVMLVVVSNLTSQKFVYLKLGSIHTFEMSVGVIFYPVTFFIINLITEFYGKTQAKFTVQLAVIINITAALIVTIMNQLEATNWSKVDNIIFNKVFGVCGITLIGSIIASYTGQLINIKLYLWLSKMTNHKYLWIGSVSTVVALLADTSIVIIFVATFSKAIDPAYVLPLIFHSYLFKLLIAICVTPLFYSTAYLVKAKLSRSNSC